MPGWYDRIRELVEIKQLQAVGIVQEQHPARTALFNQWRRLPMTLLADPLNRLDVSAVPIVLLVDEHGVIRHRNPRAGQLSEFLQRTEKDDGRVIHPWPGSHWREGDELALTGRLDAAIDFFAQAPDPPRDEARRLFRSGVVHRMRYDRDGRHQDFVLAVQNWQAALQQDPNQYIWRRRIQQYGPLLDKPYPFYNWVSAARQAVEARGERPVALSVEPMGAELASPNREGVVDELNEGAEPDPTGRLFRDEGQAVKVRALLVPATNQDQHAMRLHLSLSPVESGDFRWNNEAEPLTIWLATPDSGQIVDRRLKFRNPPLATSGERRVVETDVRWGTNEDPPARLQGYAVYNLCNKRTGECMIRRQDFSIPWPTR